MLPKQMFSLAITFLRNALLDKNAKVASKIPLLRRFLEGVIITTTFKYSTILDSTSHFLQVC